MKKKKTLLKSKKKLGSVKRKTVSLSSADLVKIESLFEDNPLPLLIQPTVNGADLIGWATNNRQLIETKLLEHGGVLFRNFEVTPNIFQQFMLIFGDKLLVDPARSLLRGPKERIYNSTRYPAERVIFFHNETWWQYNWPMHIFFMCDIAPETGGETILADCRGVLQRIEPEIREKFIEKRALHVRNFGTSFGRPWQEVFETTEKEAVEVYCQANEVNTEWKTDDRLTTTHIRDAVATHPQTAEEIWFNHVAHYHLSTNTDDYMKSMIAELGEENVPVNTYYGDGSSISDSVIQHIRDAYWQEQVAFPWQKGDILMLDNMLIAHGRASFTGDRRILVGMTNPCSWAHLKE